MYALITVGIRLTKFDATSRMKVDFSIFFMIGMHGRPEKK
jgi:hypothetical protein